MRPALVVTSGLLLAFPAAAGSSVEVGRGDDTMVYGSCVPSLVAENRSAETVDYLQVDLELTLADGTARVIELQSAYREGILYPIAPGGKAVLRQHLDISRALGAACDRIQRRKVVHVECIAAGGRACLTPVSVEP
jgi:hypothetical protein